MALRIAKLGRVRIVAIAVAFVLLLSGTIITVMALASGYDVTIHDGESVSTITTRSIDPHEILTQAGISLNENDHLDTSALVEGQASTLTILRAYNVTVQDGKAAAQNIVQYGTVKQALEQLDIELFEEDGLTPSLDTPLSEGMTIAIERAFNVSIKVDGKLKGLSLLGGTVAQALEVAGIRCGKNDEVTPAMSSKLRQGAKIVVKRVEYKNRTEEETIAFDTVSKNSSELHKGIKKVIQDGENGLEKVTYRDKYVDGKRVSSDDIARTTLRAAVDKIIRIGTKTIKIVPLKKGLTPISELSVPASLKLDGKGLPTQYKNVIVGTATAYTGDTATSTGRKPMPGHIAVDPDQIPYGTKLYVVSADGNYVYGYCIAADTGGFAETHSATVDLFMNSETQVYTWGRRAVKIYVL